MKTGTRRAKGPSRTPRDAAVIPPEAIAAGNPRCWAGCGRPGVEYKHHQWWCAQHTPSDRSDGCTHWMTSPMHGKVICSLCGEFVKEEL